MRSDRPLAVVAALVAAVALGGCDTGDEPETIASMLAPQLAYLEPESSAVVAIDLRYGGDNWKQLRPFVSRVLREYRNRAEEEERLQIPLNAEAGLQQLASFGGLDFDEDIEPVLDGHLAIGVVQPPLQPLPKDLEEIRDLADGAAFDPSRQVYVRPRQAAGGVPAPGGVPPAGGVPPPGGVPAPPRPDGRVPGRPVRKANGLPLRQEDVQRFTQADAERRNAAEPRALAVYRTEGGDLRRVVEKALDDAPLRPLPGREDAFLVEEGVALVGGDTLVAVLGDPNPERALTSALDRAGADRGFPPGPLEAVERETGMSDPLVLAAGDLTVVRGLQLEEPGFERARREVPYLSAVRRVGGALDLDDERVLTKLRVTTDPNRLSDADLPVGPSGTLELPEGDAIVGASRDQSRTTTLASRIGRSVFADSRFAEAVERAERDLGIDFEEDVLRQFNCPSVSVLEPTSAGPTATSPVPGAPPLPRPERFGARSCVGDPERMRALLPRLAPHLPRVLTALQGLGNEGLAGLLLVAPDAPLTPSALVHLAAIAVRPLRGDEPSSEEETLYEVTGLRDDATNPLAQAGPDRVVFGLIGDAFVVASDEEMAERVTSAPTREVDGAAGSAVRAPVGPLLDPDGSDPTGEAVAAVFEDLRIMVKADRRGTDVEGRLDLRR